MNDDSNHHLFLNRTSLSRPILKTQQMAYINGIHKGYLIGENGSQKRFREVLNMTRSSFQHIMC